VAGIKLYGRESGVCDAIRDAAGAPGSSSPDDFFRE